MDVLEQAGRLTDTGRVPDIFVSGLGEVEDLGGGCFRFVFYARHKGDNGEEMVIVAKLVAPMEAVPPAVIMAAKAVGFSLAAGYLPKAGLH